MVSFTSNNKKIVKEEPFPELNPRDAVIQNILNYSKALRIKKSEMGGLIEVMLN
jgi:hypothetical protein